MHECPACGATYSSILAADQCEDDDRANDLHNRQWVAQTARAASTLGHGAAKAASPHAG